MIEGPASLDGLLVWTDRGEDFRAFLELLREFVPDCERQILSAHGIDGRVAAFAKEFSKHYFELPWYFDEGEAESYADLLHSIPVIARSIDYDEMVSEMDPPFIVLGVLAEPPYRDDARLHVLEACGKWIPEELLTRTAKGYSSVLLHERLNGTLYEPAALMADWIERNTGNAFLDLDRELEGNTMDEWSRENVDYLTEHWKSADAIVERIGVLGRWVMEQPALRFCQMLNVIDGQGVDPKYDPRQLKLAIGGPRG